MKMNIKKGFTIIELVITLGILSIVTALTTVFIVTFVNIQNSSSSQYQYNKQLRLVDDVIDDYVSFISINTDDVSFSYYPSPSNQIVFKMDTTSYTLAYSDNTISITNTYTGELDYFKKTREEVVSEIDSVSFAYSENLALLTANVQINSKIYKLSYIVRTLE